MALGTVTLGKSGSVSSAPTYLIKLTVGGLGTYATGGVTGLKAAVEAKLDRSIDIVHVQGRSGVYTVEYDSANDLLLAYDDATGLEVANSTSLAGTFDLAIWGK